MQLHDAEIRPVLEDIFRAAWNPANLRPDEAREQTGAADLPDCRIDLVSWQSEPTGRATAAMDVLIAHNYRVSCEFAYPSAGSTVNAVATQKTNEALKFLSGEWPRLAGWGLREDTNGELEDNAEESTYTVTINLTIEVISPARFGG